MNNGLFELRKKFFPVIRIVGFLVFFAVVGKILDFCVYDDTALYTRIMTHELYNMDKNIDVLCLGSSHCYRSLDTGIMDDRFGMCTFDAASPMQEMDAASVIVRDVLKRNDVRHIYIELYYSIAGRPLYKERDSLGFNTVIYDKIKPSLYKFRTMLKATEPEYYPVTFIKCRRTTTNILDLNYVVPLIQKKLTREYAEFDPKMVSSEYEIYCKKGYCYGTRTKKAGSFYSSSHKKNISDNYISRDWKNSLLDIIEYCQKKGVEISLFSAPVSDFNLIDVGNYDKYIEEVNSIIEETGVEYRDFNLCRLDFFDPLANDFYEDEDHLNRKGSEAFSKLFCDYYNGYITDEDLFYGSYEEKKSDLNYEVFGTVIRRKNDSLFLEPVTKSGNWDNIVCSVKLTGSDRNEELTVNPGEAIRVGPEETGDIVVDLLYNSTVEGHIETTY